MRIHISDPGYAFPRYGAPSYAIPDLELDPFKYIYRGRNPCLVYSGPVP